MFAASQVLAQVVKNPPANSGDIRDVSNYKCYNINRTKEEEQKEVPKSNAPNQ